jgi:hypothetical protein
MYSYNRTGNLTRAGGPSDVDRVSSKGYAENNLKQNRTFNQETEVAEVVDIILDEDHPNFTAYEDIGKARVRRTVSDFNKDEAGLRYALPANPNMKTYPLIHEPVIVYDLLGVLYYISILNWKSNPNQSAAPYISIDGQQFKKESKNQRYADAEAGVPDTGTDNQILLGEEFTPNVDIKPLLHKEGDFVLEGRFGQSIRFGSNIPVEDEPVVANMKIRVGQREQAAELEYLQPIEEDVNLDPTSLYLTEDLTVPLELSTVESDIHLFSVEEQPEEYGGSQIVMNTDRILMNTKTNEIQAFAKKSINFTTEKYFTVDAAQEIRTKTLTLQYHENANEEHVTEENFTVSADGQVAFNTPTIYLGEDGNEDEPVVLGQTLFDLLDQLLQALQQETHPTPTGPSGPPINQAQYAQIQSQLQTILSQRNFTT